MTTKQTITISNLNDWETDAIDSNSIDVHVSHLRRKIGKDYIRTLRRRLYSRRN